MTRNGVAARATSRVARLGEQGPTEKRGSYAELSSTKPTTKHKSATLISAHSNFDVLPPENFARLARVQVVVRHLFISPGHNFFGHHGHPPSEHPTVEVEQVSCRAGRGLEGDRFFDYKPNYRGQVTFFDYDIFLRIRDELRVPALTSAAFRRNVVVQGLDLPSLIGSVFTIGGIQFEGSGESSPCYWMNHAVAPGAEQWLKGKGGLRAKISSDGLLSLGAAEFTLVQGQMALV